MMLLKRMVWLLFAILFYQSGLAFTTALLDPAPGLGRVDGALAAIFPVLVFAFFRLNRWAGCGSLACAVTQRRGIGGACPPAGPGAEVPGPRMPG